MLGTGWPMKFLPNPGLDQRPWLHQLRPFGSKLALGSMFDRQPKSPLNRFSSLSLVPFRTFSSLCGIVFEECQQVRIAILLHFASHIKQAPLMPRNLHSRDHGQLPSSEFNMPMLCAQSLRLPFSKFKMLLCTQSLRLRSLKRILSTQSLRLCTKSSAILQF